VQPVRFFVAELIRETIFEMYEQEVPYSAIARVEEYREGTDPLFIRATVYVERESQKPIVIGRGGAGIRELGRRSREKIEAFVGQRVYLDLWVKTLPNWRARLETLRYLGYRLPASLAAAPDDPGSGRRPDGSEPRRADGGEESECWTSGCSRSWYARSARANWSTGRRRRTGVRRLPSAVRDPGRHPHHAHR
jgi:hypothetical protein